MEYITMSCAGIRKKVTCRFRIILFLLLVTSLFLITGCDNSHNEKSTALSPATAILSLSSDGRYAITSHYDKHIILWDLENKTHKLISDNGNIFSAYYIKNSPYFMWQALSKERLTYYVVMSKPTSAQLSGVKSGKKILVANENKTFYMYYPDPKSTTGYQKKHMIKSQLLSEQAKDFMYQYDYDAIWDSPEREKLIKSIVYQQGLEQTAIQLGYYSGSTVHVQNVEGESVLNFENFSVYGQVMTSDLKQYFASDPDWSIYKGIGNNQEIIKRSYGTYTYWGLGKLLNLSLTSNNKYLLSSGFGMGKDDPPLTDGRHVKATGIHSVRDYSLLVSVVLWKAQTGQPLHKFSGNAAQTYATISPDGRYVVSGDVNIRAFLWNAKTAKKKFRLWSITAGQPIAWDKYKAVTKWNSKGLLKTPKDFVGFSYKGQEGNEQIVSMKFVDNTHYLRFTYAVPYAILYSVHDPKPLKYFPLGLHPLPAVNGYEQDEAMDTAPQAGVLAIAQAGNCGGIIEYKYDAKKQTLKKVWVGYLQSDDAKCRSAMPHISLKFKQTTVLHAQ